MAGQPPLSESSASQRSSRSRGSRSKNTACVDAHVLPQAQYTASKASHEQYARLERVRAQSMRELHDPADGGEDLGVSDNWRSGPRCPELCIEHGFGLLPVHPPANGSAAAAAMSDHSKMKKRLGMAPAADEEAAGAAAAAASAGNPLTTCLHCPGGQPFEVRADGGGGSLYVNRRSVLRTHQAQPAVPLRAATECP
ncbi:hypothetical protein BDW02DRAFT_628497 [Decorospora gaudefroyi]|uniref:Uncharacterized protein n=1 Tax=Decorospora gaudefroyi TaxID=184978 RepID=A0A6A5KMK6_9PLEO|nr:hypothetical protein BDW02DRAFT_628497 [Decorospora gaudefroyi]